MGGPHGRQNKNRASKNNNTRSEANPQQSQHPNLLQAETGKKRIITETYLLYLATKYKPRTSSHKARHITQTKTELDLKPPWRILGITKTQNKKTKKRRRIY